MKMMCSALLLFWLAALVPPTVRAQQSEVSAREIIQKLRDTETRDDIKYEDVRIVGDLILRSGDSQTDTVSVARRLIFRQATFEGQVIFEGVTFLKSVLFNEVRFRQDVSFRETEFESSLTLQGRFDLGTTLDLTNATFKNSVFFSGVIFPSQTFLRGTQFGAGEGKEEHYALFDSTTFQKCEAAGAVFKNAIFEKAVFDEQAEFAGATFSGEVDFSDARFYGDALFEKAKFLDSDVAGLESALFTGVFFGSDHVADFTGTTFEREADFSKARFRGETRFVKATFQRAALFREANFQHDIVNFAGTTFGDVFDITGADFDDETLDLTEGNYKLLKTDRFDPNILKTTDGLEQVLENLNTVFRDQKQFDNVYRIKVKQRSLKSGYTQTLEYLIIDLPFKYFLSLARFMETAALIIVGLGLWFYRQDILVDLKEKKDGGILPISREVPITRRGTNFDKPTWSSRERLKHSLLFSFRVFTKLQVSEFVAAREKPLVLIEYWIGVVMYAVLLNIVNQRYNSLLRDIVKVFQ